MTDLHEAPPTGGHPPHSLAAVEHPPSLATFERVGLEPAVSPSFRVALRGYERREVDEYVEYQQHRLAAMRRRAQRAERELSRLDRGATGRAEHRLEAPPALPVLPVLGRAPSVPELDADPGAGLVQGRKRHLCARQRSFRERVRQLVRYGACSLASVVLTEVLLAVLYGELRVGSAVACSVAASAAAAVPTFVLYRRFVWQLRGRSRLWGEVVPFCTMTAVGIAIATAGVAALVDVLPRADLHGRLARAAAVDGASLTAYGVLWVVRYVVLDRFVFGRARASRRVRPPGAAGLPTG